MIEKLLENLPEKAKPIILEYYIEEDRPKKWLYSKEDIEHKNHPLDKKNISLHLATVEEKERIKERLGEEYLSDNMWIGENPDEKVLEDKKLWRGKN
ncbi:MAG: hypothetical protein V1910_00290 [bacterium]